MHRDRPVPARINAFGPSPNPEVMTAAKGGGMLFFGRLFEHANRLVFSVIVARSIGAAGYGLYNLGMSVTIILATIALLGLPEGLVRFLPAGVREGDKAKVRATLLVGLGLPVALSLVLAVLLFGLANPVAADLLHEPAAVPVLRWISLLIPLEAAGQVLLAVALSFKHMDYQVYSYSVAFSLVKTGLTVLFLIMGLDVVGVIIANALAWVVAISLLVYFVNRLVPFRGSRHLTRRSMRELVSFSAPLCLTELTLQLRGYVDLLALGVLGTMVSVGVYGAASRIQMIGDTFLGVITRVSKPLISDLDHQGENLRLGWLYQTLTRWSLSSMLPFVATTILFAKPILAIFGDEFVAGVPVLIIVGMALVTGAGTRICHSMIVMTGHPRLAFLNTTVGLVLNLLFDLILIPAWGVVGAALATAISMTVVNIARLLQVYWLLKVWPYNYAFFKPFLATAVAVLVGLFMNRLVPAEGSLFYLVLDVVVLWSSYIATTAMLGLAEEDLMVLSRVGRRLRAIRLRS